MHDDPYAPPQADAAPTLQPNAETLRRLVSEQRRALRGLGTLFNLTAGTFVAAAVALTLVSTPNSGTPDWFATYAIFCALFPVPLAVVGHGLRELRPWSRTVAPIVYLPAAIVLPLFLPFVLVVSNVVQWPLTRLALGIEAPDADDEPAPRTRPDAHGFDWNRYGPILFAVVGFLLSALYLML
jgi:hypothetical protein